MAPAIQIPGVMPGDACRGAALDPAHLPPGFPFLPRGVFAVVRA